MMARDAATMPRRRRRAAFALLVGVLLSADPGRPVAASDAGSETQAVATLERLLRSCVRSVRADGRADPFGLVRVDLVQRCPALWAALAAEGRVLGGRERLLPVGSAPTLRQIEDLTRLVESASGPSASMRLLPAVRLGQILAALDPAARGELSSRARLARWWRSVVGEFDPLERRKSRSGPRVQWPLGFWSTVSWFAFGTAALLIVTVIVQEIRAALGPRAVRGRTLRKQAVSAGPDVDLAGLAALPPRRRAGEMLRAVADRLHTRGSLPPPVPLTPREIGRLARLPEEQRASLAVIAAAGESGAYGRRPPDEATLAAAAQAASRLLDAPRRWWERGVRS
jgi:hypothetical protein